MIEEKGFYVNFSGDSSVGIFDGEWEVTGGMIFDDEQDVADFKEALKEAFSWIADEACLSVQSFSEREKEVEGEEELYRRDRLYFFVKKAHAGQKRIGGEDYFNHLVRVANASKKYFAIGWEIGLCHDLLEDTNVGIDELRRNLKEFGYSDAEADVICSTVHEITDVFTHDSYPEFNRSQRKELESKRLSEASFMAQTVKCEDIYDNLMSYEALDNGFLPVYLKEKLNSIMLMSNCNENARSRAWFAYSEALHFLVKDGMGDHKDLWIRSLRGASSFL